MIVFWVGLTLMIVAFVAYALVDSPYSWEPCPTEYPLGLQMNEKGQIEICKCSLPVSLQSIPVSQRPYRVKESNMVEMLTMLQQVTQLFENHQIEYWAIRSTLLGSMRHSGPVPWCDTMHLAVSWKSLSTLLNLRSVLEDQCGFELYRGKKGYQIRTKSWRTWPCVDLTIMQTRENEVAIGTPLNELGDCTFADSLERPREVCPVSDVFPLKRVPFYRFELPVPQKAHECLDRYFQTSGWASEIVAPRGVHFVNRLTQSIGERVGVL